MKKSKHVWGLVGFVLGTFLGGRVYAAIRKIA
jgi:hypothetical protein